LLYFRAVSGYYNRNGFIREFEPGILPLNAPWHSGSVLH